MNAQRATDAAIRYWIASESQDSYEDFIKRAKLGGKFWNAKETL